MSVSRFMISALAIGLACVPARASLTFYSTTTAFNAAAITAGDALTPISFDQFVGVTNATETDSLSGTVFSTPTGNLDGIANPGGSWPSGTALKRTTNGSEIDITLPVGTTAFVIYVGELANASDVTLSAVSATTCASPGIAGGGNTCIDPSVSPTLTTPVFIGAISDVAITSITFISDNNFEQLAIGGFQFGEADATPETTTSLLIGSGLILLTMLHRRWSRQKPELSSAPTRQTDRIRLLTPAVRG